MFRDINLHIFFGDQQETIKNARKVFPDLAYVNQDCIVLSLGVYIKETRNKVYISPMAWPSVAATLHRYEILDVDVNAENQDSYSEFTQEKIKIIVEDVDALPNPPSYSKNQYLTVPGLPPLITPLRRSRTCEDQRPSSPDGKESTHSEKTERVGLGWFKRIYH
jgi:hypothetical protein